MLSTDRTRALADLTYWQTVKTALQAQLTARATGRPIDAYSFDSGEGRQSTDQMDLEQLIRAVQSVETVIQNIERRLYGGRILSMRLGRK